jgi:hypothetical protein
MEEEVSGNRKTIELIEKIKTIRTRFKNKIDNYKNTRSNKKRNFTDLNMQNPDNPELFI